MSDPVQASPEQPHPLEEAVAIAIYEQGFLQPKNALPWQDASEKHRDWCLRKARAAIGIMAVEAAREAAMDAHRHGTEGREANAAGYC